MLVQTPYGFELRTPLRPSAAQMNAFLQQSAAWLDDMAGPAPQRHLWGKPYAELTFPQAQAVLAIYLETAVPQWSAQMQAAPQQVRVRRLKSRWGSCSSRKAISLAVDLVQLPRALVDYVLVHELAHLHEMNHSPAFWAHVARALPDYRAHKQALKQWQRRILPL